MMKCEDHLHVDGNSVRKTICNPCVTASRQTASVSRAGILLMQYENLPFRRKCRRNTLEKVRWPKKEPRR